MPPPMGSVMSRFSFFTVLLALAVSAPAQVSTNGGYATQSGPAVPATPASPPILYAPIVRLGQGPTQPMEATDQAVAPATQTTVTEQEGQPFNFGAAQVGVPSEEGGVGQEVDGRSLAEVAREMKQKPNGTNARIYTNSDIDSLNNTGGLSGTATATNGNNQDNWSGNNGVINPDGQPANAVGAPAQNQTAPQQQGPRSPFSPPAGVTQQNNAPSNNAPQAEVQIHPLQQRGTLMAQNSEQNAPLAQNAQSSPAKADQNAEPAQNDNSAGTLPKTASRLPLLGVLGLFTISMGIFVRYQRAKAK